MGIDRQKVPGHVLEPIVARKEDERGGIGRLDDDVGDHDLQFLDASAGGHYYGCKANA